MQSLRIAYAGTPEFAVPALESIMNSHHELVAVLTQPDRKSGRGQKISKSPVKLTVSSTNMRVFQPENVNSDEQISQLERLKLDIIVVAAYGQIFSEKLLTLPKLGCINIHASLLPKWRGASPIQHAILSDGVSGVTIMQMARGMDAGDIWLQSNCEISEQDTAQSLHNKLAVLGAEIILNAIDKVADPSQVPVKQDSGKASYCSKLKKSDGLIDWNESADVILRKVRAFHPWPGAHTTFNGRRLRITKALLGSTAATQQTLAGTVIEVSKQGIVVVAGEDTVILSELVPEGKKCVSATDFSNSNQLINQIFGQAVKLS